ncbi:MAG TPA: hypothetical protein GX396_00420 [Tissierellia bacterium]|jgi:hypothetical protein|nr:hypothetical protein [Tissierellia bacterium]
MYEIRKKQREERRQQKWFKYAILAAGIFVFSQGCNLLTANTNYASTSIVLGIILHSYSAGRVCGEIFKVAPSSIGNIAMIISLLIVALISYFNNLGIIIILLLDLASIIVYVVSSFIYSKLKTQE